MVYSTQKATFSYLADQQKQGLSNFAPETQHPDMKYTHLSFSHKVILEKKESVND